MAPLKRKQSGAGSNRSSSMTRFAWLAAASAAVILSACAGQQTASSGSYGSMASSYSGTERSRMTPRPTHTAPTDSATPAEPAATAEATPPPAATPPAATAEATPPATPTSFTDTQLHSFVTASQQIDPINRSLATATPEQRTEATNQIRTVLQQNNLDARTYNAIATQAQSDQALASRIAAIQSNPNG